MAIQYDLQKFGEELEKYVRPNCFPLAVKLLQKEEDIPKEALRPKKDRGERLSLCQAYGISRRGGEVIAMLKEDMWCPEPIICYGLVEPPSYFLDGHMHFSGEGVQFLKDLEAARTYANFLPRFEVGKYIGVVSAPIMKAKFYPDLILIYCNSAQITKLVYSAGYKSGHGITPGNVYGGACIRSVVPAIKTKQYQFALPCGGDRVWGLAQNDELIFAIPGEKMGDLVEGLEATVGRYPVNFAVKPRHELHVGYMRTLEILGLH